MSEKLNMKNYNYYMKMKSLVYEHLKWNLCNITEFEAPYTSTTLKKVDIITTNTIINNLIPVYEKLIKENNLENNLK